MNQEQSSNQVPASTGDQGFTSRGGARTVLSVLFIIYMLDYVDRMVVTGMISFIKNDYGITDAQAAWLVSIVTLFITVFSIPAAIVIDRWSRRKMIAIMTAFWSIATLACMFTKTYTQLLIARAFIGIGEAGYAPAGTALLSAAYPEDKRAKVMGLWNISIPLGMGLGMAIGGLVAKHWGWHHAFGLVSIPGMVLAVVAWNLPDYKTVKKDSSVAYSKTFFEDVKKLLKTPSALFTYFAFAANVSITTAVITWLPTYFERIGVAEPGSGGAYATPIFALVVLGAPAGGFLSDYWHKRNVRGRLLFPAISSLAASAVLFAGFLLYETNLQIPIFILYGVLVTMFIAPAVAVTQDVVSPGLRALSYSLCVIIQHTAGDVWSPPLIGMISDNIGLAKAMMFIPIYGIVACILFFIASIYYQRDLERVERVQLQAE
jgi:predicted MFS family arabinose efflux permease